MFVEVRLCQRFGEHVGRIHQARDLVEPRNVAVSEFLQKAAPAGGIGYALLRESRIKLITNRAKKREWVVPLAVVEREERRRCPRPAERDVSRPYCERC